MLSGGSSTGTGTGGGGGGGWDNMIPSVPPPYPAAIGGAGDTAEVPRKDERVPIWRQAETKDLIAIRVELDPDFTAAKRNKRLWEVVAARMKGLGYRRSSDQCRSKWKNLVSRYKGKDISDQDNTQSVPFFDELHAFFTGKTTDNPQTPFDPEAGSSQSKSKKRVNEISEDEENQRKKPERDIHPQTSNLDEPPTPKPLNSRNNPIQEILHDFFEQQQMIDTRWRELLDKRAYERQMFEQERRESMLRAEMERMRTVQLWREKEEQRKAREESRAERIDALLTLLLNKLVHEQ